MEFPVKFINPLRKSGKLRPSLDALADIAVETINNGKADTLEKFCQGYIRSAGSLVDNEGQRLREVVSCLVFDLGVLRNSSIEIQWDIVCIYGPRNYTKTVQYLDSLPSFFHPKMKRLLLACEPNKMAASIVLNSSFRDINTHDWMVELKKQSPQVYLVAHHYDVDASVHQLRSLFPQLSINRAQRLLRNSSIEQATQQLLDNQDAGKQRDKKVFEPLLKNTKLAYTPDYEKTLKLANALLDDERDDEPEDEGDSHIRVFDSQVGSDDEGSGSGPSEGIPRANASKATPARLPQATLAHKPQATPTPGKKRPNRRHQNHKGDSSKSNSKGGQP